MISQKLLIAVLAALASSVESWTVSTSTDRRGHVLIAPASTSTLRKTSSLAVAVEFRSSTPFESSTILKAVSEPESQTKSKASPDDLDKTTEEYGLEAGLFQSLKKDDGGQSAKSLLAKYGVAYLATSIPLAIVSFTICYALVDSGVDVAALLSNVGITVGDTGEKVGTFAIAYTAHKAASPIRFPPTVLLTPIVAKLIGKEPVEVEVETE